MTSTTSLTNPGAEELAGKRIAVVGLGKSGRSSLRVLAELTRAVLSGWDSSQQAIDAVASSGELAEDALDSLRAVPGQEEIADAVLQWQPEIIVLAPGIREISPLFVRAEAAGIELWSEIELAWRLRAMNDDGVSAPWFCVTGTNGKTTTVSMLEAILKQAGMGGVAIGNIGTPAVVETSRTDAEAPGAFAVEVSSFQLRTTHSVSPVAATCLNFADDHLEWHGSRRAYWEAKARVYEHTRVACVYPVGDEIVQPMVDEADVVEGARAIGVCLGVPSVGQIGIVESFVIDRAFGDFQRGEGVELFEIDDLMHLAPQAESFPSTSCATP